VSTFAERRTADIIARHGETMTLRRPTHGEETEWTDVAVKGKRHAPPGGVGAELVGAMTQKALRVKITNREIAAAPWPGPPRKGDYLIIAGKEYTLVDDADTRTDRGAVLMHLLTVEG
jgi:hypothetical protein